MRGAALIARLRSLVSRNVAPAPTPARAGRTAAKASHREPLPRDPVARVRQLARSLPHRATPFAIGGAACLFGVVFWQFMHTSEYFLVKHWTISGLDRLGEAHVRHRAGGLPGAPVNLIDYDAGEAERALRALPLVRSASVEKNWPEGIYIAIEERRPHALLATGRATWLVDRDGVVLAAAASEDMLDRRLPFLSGPAEVEWKPGDRLDPQFRRLAFTYAATLADAGGPVADDLSELHWEPGIGLSLYVNGGARLVCGTLPPQVTIPRAEALARHLNGLRSVDYADLRVESHLPWKPVSVPEAVSTKARTQGR